MLDDESYNHIDSAAKAETELATNLRPKLSVLRKVFAEVYKQDHDVFTRIKDLLYYKGGWPKPDSPPRITTLLNKFGEMVQWYNHLGKFDEVAEYLKDNFGISITFESNHQSPQKHTIDDDIKTHLVRRANRNDLDIVDQYEQLSNVEFAKYLFELGCDIQGDICQTADIITEEHFPIVEQTDQISRGNFRRLVTAKSKHERSKKTAGLVKKTQSAHEECGKTLGGIIHITTERNT